MMTLNIEALPERIKSGPYWRVHFRPSTYTIRLPDEAAQAFQLIKEVQLHLRGWPYPFVSDHCEECVRHSKYAASGSDFMGHLEYWRLYFSGQFINLFAVREKTAKAWDQELRSNTEGLAFLDVDVSSIPGFIDIVNFLYHMTEIFEFASRLCGKGIYEGDMEVSVALHGIKGFSLLAQYPRHWDAYFPATANDLCKSETLAAGKLLADGLELALQWSVSFFRQFGWDNPSVDILRSDQQKFLAGRT